MSKRPKAPEVLAEDILKQKQIATQVAMHYKSREIAPLAYVDTYGCQQNVADSETIRGYLLEMGYEMTDQEAGAHLVLLNTCCVRESAENRVWGNVGNLTHTKQALPEQIIVLCGCMGARPETREKAKKSYPHIDLIFGPQALWRLPEFLYQVLTEKGRLYVSPDENYQIAEDLPQDRVEGPAAWLSIMYGCNNFCSYCIVPHVRGRERSRDPQRILEEVEKLVKDGVKDITLLGQNVNSYGLGLEEHIDFPWLLEQINAIPGEFLIRFMTSHPKDAGERLFETMAKCEKVARHIHLPVQAGNTRVLKEMNRGYTKEGYLHLIETARKHVPDIVLTGDIIVGFPGEIKEEFEDTLAVLKEVQFDALFTFLFSPRSGTPAAEMPDTISKEEKQRWFESLLALQNDISLKKHEAYVGSVLKVLVLEEKDGFLKAQTNGGRHVRLTGDTALIGQFITVEITRASIWALEGQVVST